MKMLLTFASLILAVYGSESIACSVGSIESATVAQVEQLEAGSHVIALHFKVGIFQSSLTGLQAVANYDAFEAGQSSPINRLALVQFNDKTCQPAGISNVTSDSK